MAPCGGPGLRLYMLGALLRVLLALTPLSTLHPDEWMQSAEVMAPQLLPGLEHVATWDWQFTCHNPSHPPHLPHALRPVHDDEEWQRAMRRPLRLALTPAPSWMRCPDGMQVQMPIRNTLFPWLSSGLPFQLYRWAWERTQADSSPSSAGATERRPAMVVADAAWLLFLLPRAAMLSLSFACDYALYRAARGFFPRSSPGAILGAYSVAFPALVFMGRTFSNAFETTLLALSLWIASAALGRARGGSSLQSNPQSSSSSVSSGASLDALCLLFGLVVGTGAFVRLSFLFWAWPIGVALIAAHFLMRRRAPTSRMAAASGVIGSAIRVSTLVALPCAAVAALLCLIDSLYFRTLWLCHNADTLHCSSGVADGLHLLATSLLSRSMPHARGSLLLTPLTNYWYNSDSTNVSYHGRHPHYLHVTVNLVLLLGPVAYARLLSNTWRAATAALGGRTVADAAKGAAEPTMSELAQQAPPLDNEESKNAPSLRLRKTQLTRHTVAPVATGESSSIGCAASSSSSLSSSFSGRVSVWVDVMFAAVAWSGLLLLSLVPHQEARFLLPITIPAALLARPREEHSATVRSASTAASVDQNTPAAAASPPSHPGRRRRRCAVSTLHLLHGVCTVVLLGVLHQGGLLPTLVRPDLWRRSMDAVAAPPASCPSSALSDAGPPPESWLLLSYKTYTLPTSFVHAHVREMHSASSAPSPCAPPPPLLSIIDVGDEASVGARVAQAAREQQGRYSAARPTASPLRLHYVLLLWPGSVAAPVQQLREAHAALLPNLQRNLTREQELSDSAASRTVRAPSGSSELTLQVLCPPTSTHARGCVELRTRGAIGGAGSPSSSSFSSFPHLSLDDAPGSASGSLSLRDQLALHAAVFDLHLLPSD